MHKICVYILEDVSRGSSPSRAGGSGLRDHPSEGLFVLEWIEGDWRGLNPLLYKFV
jgi:hypothetical protein